MCRAPTNFVRPSNILPNCLHLAAMSRGDFCGDALLRHTGIYLTQVLSLILPYRLLLLKTSSTRNAKARSIEFLLDASDVQRIAEKANGRCMVSGIPFSNGRSRHRKDPWAPSIDRIENSLGYTPENCRLVCTAVNLAMNEWGENVLRRIAESMVKTRRKSR
jgi:hypothetical protein